MEKVNNIKTMEVSNPWAKWILDGIKTVEVRKGGGTWANLEKGDILRILEKGGFGSKDYKVVDIRSYKSLLDCFIAEGVKHLLPGMSTLQEGYDVYFGFDGKDKIKERQKEFEEKGALAIELGPIENKSLINSNCNHKNVIYNHDKREEWKSKCKDCEDVWLN